MGRGKKKKRNRKRKRKKKKKKNKSLWPFLTVFGFFEMPFLGKMPSPTPLHPPPTDAAFLACSLHGEDVREHVPDFSAGSRTARVAHDANNL